MVVCHGGENTCFQTWPCGLYYTAVYGCSMVMTLRADILNPAQGTSLLHTVLDGPVLSIMSPSLPICDPALCGLQLFLQSCGASRKCLRFIQVSTSVVVTFKQVGSSFEAPLTYSNLKVKFNVNNVAPQSVVVRSGLALSRCLQSHPSTQFILQ